MKVEGVPPADTRSKTGDVHIVPLAGKKHVSSSTCWCRPTKNFTGATGNVVWVHRIDN